MTARPEERAGAGAGAGVNEGAGFAASPRARAARWVAVTAVAALAVAAIPALRASWGPERASLLASGSGWVACAALLISLAVTAVGRSRWSARWPIPAPVLRRAFGMAAAWLGGVHATAAVLGPLDGRLDAVVTTSHLIAGLSALAVLALLLLTSFERAIRWLRLHYWKELHRLSYVAAFLVAQHVLLAPFADRRVAIGLAGVVVGLVALRLGAGMRRRRPR